MAMQFSSWKIGHDSTLVNGTMKGSPQLSAGSSYGMGISNFYTRQCSRTSVIYIRLFAKLYRAPQEGDVACEALRGDQCHKNSLSASLMSLGEPALVQAMHLISPSTAKQQRRYLKPLKRWRREAT